MRKLWLASWLAAAGLGFASCEDSSGPGGPGTVAVRITTSQTARNGSSDGELRIEGTNGILSISEIRLIVAEFELEADDESCSGSGDCEFERGPFFLKLPLTSGSVTVTTDRIPPGTFKEIEFEVERLEDEDAALLAQIRAEFADWPGRASMMVVGTFTPVGGSPVPFRTFFDAEIEVEVELADRLVVTESNQPEITIEVNPQRWFRRANGTVKDLSLLDFARTGILARFEFEVEIEEGFEIARVRQ